MRVDLDALLQSRFGFPAFRPGQLEIVEHVVNGGDALVVMPTGAGKSLCYQVPALARGGLAIVVSPLIALMKDQVDALVAKKVKATFLNSSLTAAEYRTRSDALRNGQIEILYVAPERFSPAFVDMVRSLNIRLLAIDEAHCLSQWGHDFRPDYLRLGHVRRALGNPTTIALTATATPEVQKDIVETLGLDAPPGAGRPPCGIFIRGFDRDNLINEVHAVEGKNQKNLVLPELVGPGPAIVYCATRKNVESATKVLRDAGIRAGSYHGGLSTDDRSRVQDDFMGGKIPVVVATNAFGMGIDKRDIRAIVHYDLPGTVEAYYQEIGRAGRDGRMARAVLLYSPSDRRTQEFFIDNGHPPAEWVHRLWRWLVERGENPVFASVEDMAAALPGEGGDRSASACLYTLVREGMVRRIAPGDRSAYIRVAERGPRDVPHGLRRTVWEMILARQIGPGEALDFSLDAWAREADCEREKLTAAILGLMERGYLTYRAPERVGGVELLKPNEPLKLDEVKMKARRSREYAKLDKMEAYAGSACRRRFIVEYFGEKAPFERCGTCDRCRAGGPEIDDTPRMLMPDEETVVLKLLSCVARMQRHTGRGEGFSVDLIAKTAMGSSEEKVRQFGFDTLSTWGILGPKAAGEVKPIHWSVGELADLLTALVANECLIETYQTRTIGAKQVTYKELSVSPRGWRVLRKEERDLKMVFPHAQRLERAKPKTTMATAGSVLTGELVSLLRDVRTRLAQKHELPPYVVASNKSLEDMARIRPTSKKALLTVHGFGEVKSDRFGTSFIDAIRKYNEGRL